MTTTRTVRLIEQDATAAGTGRRLDGDAVFSFCSGYPAAVYERFIGSLFTSGFTGTLMLFVDEADLTEQFCKTIAGLAGDVVLCAVDRSHYSHLHCQNYRYYAYRELLMRPEMVFRRVMLSDARDVLFQGNVFTHPLVAAAHAPDLFFFREPITIRECPVNRRWLDLAVGVKARESIEDGAVLCSGTTVGTRDAIAGYLDVMCSMLGEAKVTSLTDAGGRIRHTVLDQALHNYMFYSGTLAERGLPVHVCGNEDNLVHTLAYSIARGEFGTSVGLDEDSRTFVHIATGERARCVHQFERLQLLPQVWARFRASVAVPLDDFGVVPAT